MKPPTRYFYEQKIKRLESENSALHRKLSVFERACIEIHKDALEVLNTSGTAIKLYWIFTRLNQVWRKS